MSDGYIMSSFLKDLLTRTNKLQKSVQTEKKPIWIECVQVWPANPSFPTEKQPTWTESHNGLTIDLNITMNNSSNSTLKR
ncbi:hypothetical protein [Halalkalibacter okhensis]|uniref:Uncharacterized protein n=1 Tax=Halalkalibacter okhensis TaxID=333138 RepID=A0A0B0I6E2_9BACI|nr:hypothetical protein [Halalkalibacter okhensis]KHF38038.1 hypothetical protein LQ50_23565 [Halalkalibacter okhensis]